MLSQLRVGSQKTFHPLFFFVMDEARLYSISFFYPHSHFLISCYTLPIIKYPVFRSTNVTIRTRLSRPWRVSPSKSPILERRSTTEGLSSIRRFLACSRAFCRFLVPCFLRYFPFCDLKYIFRCGARSLMYRYMVRVSHDCCFFFNTPAICSGDL